MPGMKKATAGEDVNGSSKKKRSLEESRAAAKRYRDSLTSAKSPGKRPVSPTDDTPSSASKKARRQEQGGPSSARAASVKKEAALSSRKRAQEFARTLAQKKLEKNSSNGGGGGGGVGAEHTDTGVTGDTTESEHNENLEESDADMASADETERRARPTTSPALVPTPVDDHSNRRTVISARLPPTPPMPDPRMSRPPTRPVPPTLPPTTYGGGGHAGPPALSAAATTTAATRAGRKSFLHHAIPQTPSQGNARAPAPAGAAQLPVQPRAGRQSFLSRAVPNGANAKPVATTPTPAGAAQLPVQPRAGRQSFLSPAVQNGINAKPVATTPTPLPPSPQRTPPVPVEADGSAGAIAGHGEAAAAAGRTPVEWKRWVKTWAYTGLLALAPLLLSALLWGIFLPAWSQIQPVVSDVPRVVASIPSSMASATREVAKDAWDRVPSFVPKSSRKKCFLARGDDPSICKEGTEVVECPASAVCGVGKILYCNLPFERDDDGERCTLTAAAMEEADIVFKSLRNRTIAELCSTAGLFLDEMPSMSVTLREAAEEANRQPLSMLAALPPGDVEGLLRLDGPPALAFGGTGEGGGGGSGGVDRGPERVARLSEAALANLQLPRPCEARRVLFRLLRAHWKIVATILFVFATVLCWDTERRERYRRHKEVCSIRNESYKALLDHSANGGGPMQVSHIQDFVVDKRRGAGAGSVASTKKMVQNLWADVEREVDLDSRIRRIYQSVRGQRNVPCWEWQAPSASYEAIGGLDPGPPPTLLLLKAEQPTASAITGAGSGE